MGECKNRSWAWLAALGVMVACACLPAVAAEPLKVGYFDLPPHTTAGLSAGQDAAAKDYFRRVAERIVYHKPHLRLVSNVTGQLAGDEAPLVLLVDPAAVPLAPLAHALLLPRSVASQGAWQASRWDELHLADALPRA